MRTNRITSISWLHCADGSFNLTPCINGNNHPTIVNITKEEFADLNGEKEAMKLLAARKLDL